MKWGSLLGSDALAELTSALQPLCGTQVQNLRLPRDIASQIEPSQVGTIVGTLTDLLLPSIALSQGIGLTKAVGLLGDREGYPDFEHEAGYRLELKGAFRDNPDVALKRPPTPREPSARLTQKVSIKNVQPETDALLLIVYQLGSTATEQSILSPTIIHVGLFPAIECVLARDARMISTGGRWFGNYETPTILSRLGKLKRKEGAPLNESGYGRKESEGYDFNEDTNFGKLKRIPFRPLQEFLRDSGCQYAPRGVYPQHWSMSKEDSERALVLEVAAEQAAQTDSEVPL